MVMEFVGEGGTLDAKFNYVLIANCHTEMWLT